MTVPFRNSIGLAELDDESGAFRRKFTGPIIDRTRDEPHFCASNCVILDESIYKIWYLSCTSWETLPGGSVRHCYHIKYATSEDGVNWVRNGEVAIDYSSHEEYAISVPRVIKENGIYKMWFSSRGSKQSSSYAIRYAESSDGIKWHRYDDAINFVGSSDGWDHDMQCYPFIFDAGGARYMLYNGNGYGRTGFGLARLDQLCDTHSQRPNHRANEHQSRVTTSTHLHQNNASKPCFLTPFAKIYWHSSRALRHLIHKLKAA